MSAYTNKMSALPLVVISLYSLLGFVATTDPGPLQDFCVAVDNPYLFTNGKFCKNPNTVTPDDFSSSLFRVRGDVNNRNGANVTRADVNTFPGLNTQGISMATIDFAPYGQNQPHTHPRATQLSTVVEGVVLIAFVASNQGTTNRFFSKISYPGDIFVVPRGLIHFERNIGFTPARVVVAFNSQEPGVETIANAMFNSTPMIPDDILRKTFMVNQQVIEELKAQFRER